MAKWHKGPPPSIGWWPASSIRDADAIRWWSGSKWSLVCYDYESAIEAAWCAELVSNDQDIEWQHRPASWPERSRT